MCIDYTLCVIHHFVASALIVIIAGPYESANLFTGGFGCFRDSETIF